MKIEVKETPVFNPITVEITLESQTEVNDMSELADEMAEELQTMVAEKLSAFLKKYRRKPAKSANI